MMTTNEWGIFHFITDSGLLKKDQLKQDVGKINAFYLNNGFINAQVGEPEITHDRDGITVKIPISEGKQFRVGKVAITGDELATPRAELLTKLQIKKKDFYDRDAIMKDMDYLTQVCNDEGYANADVVPRTEPQEKTQTVDVTYVITKRKPVYFNRINITGNTKTRDKVIRRELSVVEGDLYSRTKLKDSYMALNRLRYFDEIDFQAEKGPDETLTDVNIHVKEKPTGMFSIGAGYSALDHAIVSAQVSQQNLFGRGQTLSLKASLGASSTLYDLSFIEPWLFDMPLWSKFDLWNLYREYDSYKLDSKGFGTTLGYPLWPYVTGYVGYRLSIDNVRDILDTASYFIKKQAGQTTSSGVSLSVTRDTTDDVMFPSTGSKNSASVEYTGGPLLGDVSYTRFGADLLLVLRAPPGHRLRRPRKDRLHDGQRGERGPDLRAVLSRRDQLPSGAPGSGTEGSRDGGCHRRSHDAELQFRVYLPVDQERRDERGLSSSTPAIPGKAAITSAICGKRPAWGFGGTLRSVPSVWNGGMSSTRRKTKPPAVSNSRSGCSCRKRRGISDSPVHGYRYRPSYIRKGE